MKKIISLMFISLFLFSFVSAEIVPDFHKLKVTLVNQNPDPVSPGEIFDLRFKVENLGGYPAEDIVFEFIEEYPFSVYSGDSKREIGSLQGLQRIEEGIIVLYKVKVDEDAVENVHYVDVRYKVNNGEWITINDFPVYLRTRDAVLSVDSINSDPALISPGDDFELSFTLRNNANSVIRDVKVNLDLSGDVPFAPSKSTSEQQIYQINSKTGKIMRFDLVALPDADGGIYKIPIELSYTDETGEFYSKNDIISLKVSSSSDLLVTIDSSEIKGKVKEGEVVFKIVNRGLTDIKLVSAKIKDSGSSSLLSEPEVYIGNIDSDDYETVDYLLKANNYDAFIPIVLELSYRDSTNNLHSESFSLELKTFSPSFAQTIFSFVFNLIIFVLIIVGILFVIRWYRKRKVKRKG